MKRPVLGKGADILFEITTPEVKEDKVITSKLPKFRTFEIKLSILLKNSQLEFLNRLERKIMLNRSSYNKKERVTKNSIIRACIDAISSLEIDISEIPDERELLKRIKLAVDAGKH
ncbi:TPA: hypothetical protein DCX16_06525 [bacterium]|nr:hypothetical protein [bacterium]